MIVDDGLEGTQTVTKLKERYCPGGWEDDRFNLLSKADFELYYPDRFQAEAAAALALEDKAGKKKAKKELLDSVLAWVESNDAAAKAEFEASACEIIEILRRIDGQL